MIDSKTINELIGVSESYKAPEILLKILLDEEKKNALFKKFLNIEKDLSYDWFTNYFQDEQGDRATLKQDYTPDCLTELLCKLSAGSQTYRDVCAGCGGLTIKTWNANKNAEFVCEEFSSRAIPFLLFNLSIRKINAVVLQRDVLSMETKNSYKLENGQIEPRKYTDGQQDVCISNPPYSLKFEAVDGYSHDKRYQYGLPPKKAADYCFAQHCLYYCKEKTYLILPHGVLFRGNREEEIRKKMIEANVIETVIGLPANMFLNTGIPVQIMVLNKHKTDNSILVIDASKEFEKNGKQNRMTEANISKCIDAYAGRKDIEKYSHLASMQEIESNDFNLNIPRYVDTTEDEPVPDLIETIKDINSIDAEIKKAEAEIFKMVDQLQGTSQKAQEYLGKAKEEYKKREPAKKRKEICESSQVCEQIGMKL